MEVADGEARGLHIALTCSAILQQMKGEKKGLENFLAVDIQLET